MSTCEILTRIKCCQVFHHDGKTKKFNFSGFLKTIFAEFSFLR